MVQSIGYEAVKGENWIDWMNSLGEENIPLAFQMAREYWNHDALEDKEVRFVWAGESIELCRSNEMSVLFGDCIEDGEEYGFY